MRLPSPARPTLGSLLWILVFGLVLLDAPTMVGGDSDLSTHIRYGRLIVDTRWLPQHDSLLFTVDASHQLILQEWLFELTVATLDAWFGLAGPLILGGALAATSVWLVHQALRQARVGVWLAIGGSLLGFVGSRMHLTTRPHLVSWLLCVPWWMLLDAARSKRLGLAPAMGIAVAVTVLWTNLHGGFLLAPVLAGAAAAGAMIDALLRRNDWAAAARLLAIAAASGVATLVNPWGWGLHGHLYTFITDPYVIGGTTDFAAPSVANGALPVLIGVLVLLCAAMLPRVRHLPMAHLLPFVALAIQSAGSQRQLPYLALVGALIAMPHLQRWMNDSDSAAARTIRESSQRLAASDPAWGGIAWPLGAIAVSVLLHGVLGVVPVQFDPRTVPVASMEYVNQHPELYDKPVYTEFIAGGYMLYGTEVPAVFIHPLNANYPPDLLREFERIDAASEGWNELLMRRNIGWTVQLAGRPLATALDEHPCWSRAQSDRAGVVHVLLPACR